MDEGIVAGLRGDWPRIVDTVRALCDNEPSILLAEDWSPMERPRFEPLIVNNLKTLMPRGRIFNRVFEVRWRQVAAGSLTMTYLSESLSANEEIGFISSAAAYTAAPGHPQKLYGKWSNALEDWVEVSVPGTINAYHRLVKFDPPPPALQIDTVDYFLEGRLCMTRFRCISEFK
jgi:hypothetical protein